MWCFAVVDHDCDDDDDDDVLFCFLDTPKKSEDHVVRVVGKRNSGGRDASGVAVDSVPSGLETRRSGEILTVSPSLRLHEGMSGEVDESRSEEMVEEIGKEKDVGRRMSLRSTDLSEFMCVVVFTGACYLVS